MIGKALHRQRARNVLCDEPEYLGVVGFADQVHLAFGIVRQVLQSIANLAAKLVPVGRREQHARIEQFVEHDRVALQVIRRPARFAGDIGDARERLRMLIQKREVRSAAAHRFDQSKAAL